MSDYSKFGNWKNVATWNIATGCTKISEGCENCYAETLCLRNQGRRNVRYTSYTNGFNLTVHEDRLYEPRTYISPRLVIVNSMGDFFHESIPFQFIRTAFEVMNECQQHTFAFITKRAERLAELSSRLLWTPNIWAGVTVENGNYTNRIDCLRQVNSNVRFISFEPLIDSIPNLNLEGIQWALVGGETGVRARPMNPAWASAIIEICHNSGVLVYFQGYGRWAPLDCIVSNGFRNRIQEQLRGEVAENHTPIPYRDFQNGVRVYKLKGKRQANRLIGGLEWNEMPSIANVETVERSGSYNDIALIRNATGTSNISAASDNADYDSNYVADIRRMSKRNQGN